MRGVWIIRVSSSLILHTKDTAQTFVCAVFFCAEDAGVEERKVEKNYRRPDSPRFGLSAVRRAQAAAPVECTETVTEIRIASIRDYFYN